MNKKWLIGAMASLVLMLFLVLWQKINPNSYKLDAIETHAITMQQKHILSIIQYKEKQKNSSNLVVVDLRSEAEYKTNSIKDAVNIPFAGILDNPQLSNFKSTEQEMVLFSGSLIESAQAWTLLAQLGYQNIFILDFTGSSIPEGEITDSISVVGNEVLKYKFQADTSTNLE
ncbi:MAG: rhodanese-like domain-containing protein [Salinivirgaceae bacterium]|jgi:rhodanese-related sulfurtransferase